MGLMIRAKEKMDKLQKELDNVRRDFLKLSSLVSPECNRDVGEKMNCHGEGEKMPQISSALSFEGNREFVHSHSARNLSRNRSGSNPNVGVKMDSVNDEEKKGLKLQLEIKGL